MRKILTALALLSALFFPSLANASERFITFNNGSLLISQEGQATNVYVDPNDEKGVALAVANLCEDFSKVTGTHGWMTGDASEAKVVVGTVGHSAAIDHLCNRGLIDQNAFVAKRELYIIQVVGNQLVIAGSDRRGTIYGIYELSRQMGVSPWYWWADVPTMHRATVYANEGSFSDGEPKVRYRGIFLNDEAPCLTSWVKHAFGTNYGGHEFYSKVYELLLRLKGNFLWPAMWCWAFYADDPENSRLADEMGIIVGTSHHEPMARNHQEWARHRKAYGEWNYATNRKVIDKFFEDGIKRMEGTEDIVTIGMRGDGDAPMSKATDTKLLESVVKNQRRIIERVTGKPAKETPQVWALYKEVQNYYDAGMRVPDDVTLLLTDDNWGDVRRVPLTQKERQHPGGWGLYYHVDYVGTPRNSKWLNVTPTQNMWEQLSLAQQYGIDRLWVLNVGDLKPMEYQIDFFLEMAWGKIDNQDPSALLRHTMDFCQQQFGEQQASEAARILNLSCKYAGRSTGELLNASTYNITTDDWDKAVADYDRLESDALRQFIALPKEYHDAYEQLILFPIQAMANLYRMYHAQAMNLYLAKQGDPAANEWADFVGKYFRQDSLLMIHYNHDIAGGKWQGMMTQKHIGYTTWNDNFPHDVMPKTKRVDQVKQNGGYVFRPRDGYIAMEAEHFFAKHNAADATWTLIPYMGRTLSALSLQPYTSDPKGASLAYRFRTNGIKIPDKLRIHVVTKSTLDFLNQGGLRYAVSIDGGEKHVIAFNERLNIKPENVYSIYYPTVASRVVDTLVELPAVNLDANTPHTLTIEPLDPGIVFEKIVVDLGGYTPQHLFGKESPKQR